jgi:hypothetical protein
MVAAVVAGAIVNRDDAPQATPTAAEAEFADECEKDDLPLVEPGALTIGVASPSEHPWLEPGRPAPEGLEADIVRAVA